MTTVIWKGLPKLQDRMRRASAAVQRGTVTVAERNAAEAEAWMKANAPWNDQSGAARAGLFAEAEATPTGAIIVLDGTVEYQPYLEEGTALQQAAQGMQNAIQELMEQELGMSRTAPRPIIGPAFERTARAASEDLRELGGSFGEGA